MSKIDRRHILRSALAGGALALAALPERWTRPVVRTLLVPAHAASSPATTTAPRTTVAVAPTTTLAATTTARATTTVTTTPPPTTLAPTPTLSPS